MILFLIGRRTLKKLVYIINAQWGEEMATSRVELLPICGLQWGRWRRNTHGRENGWCRETPFPSYTISPWACLLYGTLVPISKKQIIIIISIMEYESTCLVFFNTVWKSSHASFWLTGTGRSLRETTELVAWH